MLSCFSHSSGHKARWASIFLKCPSIGEAFSDLVQRRVCACTTRLTATNGNYLFTCPSTTKSYWFIFNLSCLLTSPHQLIITPHKLHQRLLLLPIPYAPSRLLPVIFFEVLLILLIYDITLISAIQQSDSAIHTHIAVLFQILFPYGLSQTSEQSSLYSTATRWTVSVHSSSSSWPSPSIIWSKIWNWDI